MPWSLLTASLCGYDWDETPKTFIAIAYRMLLILARNDGARFPINRQALMKDTVDTLEKMLLMLFRFITQ